MLGLLFAVTVASPPTGDGPRPQVMAPETTVEQLNQVLAAAGGLDRIEPEPIIRAERLHASNSRFFINMFPHSGQFSNLSRKEDYYTDYPVAVEKADVIRTPEDAKNRTLKFIQDANWNWEGVEVLRQDFFPDYKYQIRLGLDDYRRAHSLMLWETSTDPRRSRSTLRHGSVTIDAQYGHILRAYSSFRQPLGPWRLTVSESKARRVALAEWTRAGFRFRDSHLTSQAKWIRTTSMPGYLPDQPYIAGWVIIARRDAKDRGATHSIWVHGETGAIVARHEPPVMSSPIGT